MTMPRKSAKYTVLCIAIRQARAKRRTCRLYADVYVQSCTYRIVQIRSYRFVCTDSYVQTRTYKLVRTSSYIQARTYGFVRTDAYCDKAAALGSKQRVHTKVAFLAEIRFPRAHRVVLQVSVILRLVLEVVRLPFRKARVG